MSFNKKTLMKRLNEGKKLSRFNNLTKCPYCKKFMIGGDEMPEERCCMPCARKFAKRKK